ncbi:MAG TPA: tetratricopeptide repeat protein [Armatimonadota bacterium]|nr:tetratricopeptide repeat protein [Armatimonadota bacterium]
MTSRLPRWLLIVLIAVAVAALVTGLVFMSRSDIAWVHWTGLILSGVLLALFIIFVVVSGPQLLKLYRFQKYFKAHEAQLRLLPTLMQTGRTQEAMMRFEGVMKHAPDNAYLYYMKAFFLKAAGKLPEAMVATNKALSLVGRDPYLQVMLQQIGGQMGQPTTIDEFKTQLEDLRHSLEPRVSQMRERHDKAVSKRKKKSR